MQKSSNITVICGHYGSGKTNLCMNLALESASSGRKTVIMDMDIVNPYFRSSEYGNFLKKNNIQLIAPTFANTTLDTPVLPPQIYSIFNMENANIFVDVGGDDAGATALGILANNISEYEMIYVINRNRVLSRDPHDAAELLREIEGASRLKATGIVNNTHLGVETTYDDVISSQEFVQDVAEKTGLPVLYSTIPDFALQGHSLPEGFRPVKRLVLFPWETEE